MRKSIINFLSKLNWEWFYRWKYGSTYLLKLRDHAEIAALLNEGNYLILTRRKSHFSTYMVALGHWFLTGRWGYYSHISMNIENGVYKDFNEFKFIESVGEGVRIAEFHKVLNCDSVAILKPKCPTGVSWEDLIAKSLLNLGKKYDLELDLKDHSKMNCVELILDALSAEPDHEYKFHGLYAEIKQQKNLTPDMFYECGSFDVLLEIRR